MRYSVDVAASELSLWTYKEGLLSRVAHDLCIRATTWEGTVERDGDQLSVSVSIPVSGLKVQGQAKGTVVTPLKDKDHREIESNLAGKKGLDAARFPQITFEGKGTEASGRVQVQGTLSIRDQKRPMTFSAQVREDGDVLVAEGEAEFKQSEFGVRPYSAMMGALKVQDGVRVSWSVRCRKL